MADSYDLTIILNGEDITQSCPFDKLGHDDNLRSPSYFNLVYENATFAPEQGMQLLVIAKSMPGAPAIFNGFVLELHERKRDNAISLEYELDCGDIKALLAKAVVGYGEYAGTDAEIIADLFGNSYPDLSQFIDFTSGVDAFGDDLAFTTNDESLLDALNRFLDQTGGNARFDAKTGDGGIRLSFTPEMDVTELGVVNTGGATPYWYAPFPTQDYTGAIDNTGGVPGHCVKLTHDGSYSAPGVDNGYVNVHVGSAASIENIQFDIKIEHSNTFGVCTAKCGDDVLDIVDELIEGNKWYHVNAASLNPGAFPFTVALVGSEYRIYCGGSFGSINNGGAPKIFIDNVIIDATVALETGGKDKLVYGPLPEPADFDFDIDNSTEFGSDFDLNIGAIDDFNSVTVVGGKERVAVDEALESDGSSVYMKLPFAVRSLAVYKNTGSDVSPSWTAQDLGVDGTDEITDKDVLHNPKENFLYFATTPADMRKSVRITGFREKPIRVRVENIGEGDLPMAGIVSNENITSQEEAIAYGNALLAKKNAPRRLEFKTHNEGLKVGQELTVVDTNRGLSESLIIRRMSTKWIGSSSAEFIVECGDDEASSIDSIIIGVDQKATKSSAEASFTTPVINKLLDDDDEQLLDDDGGLLYEVA